MSARASNYNAGGVTRRLRSLIPSKSTKRPFINISFVRSVCTERLASLPGMIAVPLSCVLNYSPFIIIAVFYFMWLTSYAVGA